MLYSLWQFDVSAADLDKLLREKRAAELLPDYHLETEESVALAKALGVICCCSGNQLKRVLACLTDHGREPIAAAAESVP